MRNGKYLKSATDEATMVPIFEMAGGKFKCFDEPLYIYTKDHPNSHHNNKNLTINKQIIKIIFLVNLIIPQLFNKKCCIILIMKILIVLLLLILLVKLCKKKDHFNYLYIDDYKEIKTGGYF